MQTSAHAMVEYVQVLARPASLVDGVQGEEGAPGE